MILTVGVTSDTKKWEKMKATLQRGQSLAVKVGWFAGKTHSNGRSQGVPLAQIASWLEHGHMNGGRYAGTWTPPRPFIRMGFMFMLQNTSWLQKQISWHLPMILDGRITWEGFYRKLGPELVKLMQAAMDTWSYPSNSPLTQSLKGFNNPLIESGELRNNADWKLGRKERVV